VHIGFTNVAISMQLHNYYQTVSHSETSAVQSVKQNAVIEVRLYFKTAQMYGQNC